MTTLRDRFATKVAVPDENGCWLWTAGTAAGYGRIREGGKGTRFLGAHRLAWEWANGQAVPSGMVVDHVCRRRACVNPEHLRLATRAQNQQNRSGPQSNGKSGHRGVCWIKSKNRWRAYVSVAGQQQTLGLFRDLDEAARVAEAARQKTYGEFAGR